MCSTSCPTVQLEHITQATDCRATRRADEAGKTWPVMSFSGLHCYKLTMLNEVVI
jgi:hypothetical protein